MIHMVVLVSCDSVKVIYWVHTSVAAINIGDITKIVPMMVVITATCGINKTNIRCITTEQILWVINLIVRCWTTR